MASDAEPARSFGWQDMFVHPDDDPRPAGGFAGERATLAGYLRGQRLTLELKCAGLDAGALARRSVPPSNLSLLGLVRHLTDVERYWFRQVMAGQDTPWHYRPEGVPGADFDEAAADDEVVAESWLAWRDEVGFAERYVAGASDLDVSGDTGDGPIALREVLAHMIQEYARHNGHADLLRERIDGRVGE